jgi:hypothetical protein
MMDRRFLQKAEALLFATLLEPFHSPLSTAHLIYFDERTLLSLLLSIEKIRRQQVSFPEIITKDDCKSLE